MIIQILNNTYCLVHFLVRRNQVAFTIETLALCTPKIVLDYHALRFKRETRIASTHLDIMIMTFMFRNDVNATKRAGKGLWHDEKVMLSGRKLRKGRVML